MGTTTWPFTIIRSYGTGDTNKRFMEALFAAQDRHPGLIEEIWFGGGDALETMEQIRDGLAQNLGWRDDCRKRGIAFSFQQGITLNHSADGPHPGFTDDAWVVDASGNRLVGMLCPNSKEAVEANRRCTELVLSEMKPDSYWPDDDLRYSKAGNRICFCDRCIALFNNETGRTMTREELSSAIFGDTPDAKVRKDWKEFNRRNLGKFAKVYRETVDKVLPSCRLGIQTIAANVQYDGYDYKPLLGALSGPDGKPIGIRPGSGYYTDNHPWDMIAKGRSVMLESTRCDKYGFIAQKCYESENWPHVSAEKNPSSQMLENALALACGCDSIAHYWGTDTYGETPENYAYWFDILAKWKPYFLAIRDAFAGTVPCGVAPYDGLALEACEGWFARDDYTMDYLSRNAVPVCCDCEGKEAYWINARRVAELTNEDLSVIFSGPVLMDITALNALRQKFSNIEFTRKIDIVPFAEMSACTAHIACFEIFPGDYQARNVVGIIKIKDSGVRPYSSINGQSDACGTCVIETEFGGSVVLFQDFDICWLWSGPRRKAILDALDSISTNVHARLITDGYSVAPIVRANASGKTAGVFLLNGTCGETPPLKLEIRMPAFTTWKGRTENDETELKVISRDDNRVLLEIPPMRGWSSMLICN